MRLKSRRKRGQLVLLAQETPTSSSLALFTKIANCCLGLYLCCTLSRQVGIVFLHLNSVINPFLASFRISELKRSCAIVLGLQRQVIETTSSHFLSSATRCEARDTANQATGCCLENLKNDRLRPPSWHQRVNHVQEWFNWPIKAANMACPKETASSVCPLALRSVGLGWCLWRTL